LKFKFLLRPVKTKTGLKPVFNNSKYSEYKSNTGFWFAKKRSKHPYYNSNSSLLSRHMRNHELCVCVYKHLLSVISRSNHLLESSTGSQSSSQSPLTSSRSSPYLSSSQGNRSRHNSSQGYNSVAAWLKDIRLHKYTDKLAKYTWEEVSFPCRLNIHTQDTVSLFTSMTSSYQMSGLPRAGYPHCRTPHRRHS